jgi:hypothetical protein
MSDRGTMPGRVETEHSRAGAMAHGPECRGLQANGRTGDRTTRHRATQVSTGISPEK